MTLSDEERAALEGWVRRRSTLRAWALRCRIILACATGASNKDVAAQLGSTPHAVGRWRKRFVEHRIAGLGDMPRPGGPRTVTDEQVAAVVTKTLESTPKNATHWSTRAMAKEMGLSQSGLDPRPDYHKGVDAEQTNYNGTSRTARSTFTSEVTGKIGIAYSGELKVGGSAAVVEIEGKFGVELSVELTAKLGSTIAVDTPSKHSTHARYGVYRLKSYGYSQYLYANCTIGVKKNVTIYTPRRVGWVLWETR
ncbi:helix-turn-helix domain-containing protein [Streptomyces sp. JHA26]|uniref:helix-turn-helix domain-containing protein n=1 Tax=Streptomyces sp. JHA26 TaxID=1917143 RepID=UPI00209A9131|nr:helix-turn-helix domain-containing protein [Streptomyces sp. JHA26]